MRKRGLTALLGTMLLATTALGGVINVQAEGNEEITEIFWQWPSTGTTYEGLQDVEDALNAMMEPDIGVHVTLEPVAFSELVNRLTLDVSSGTQVDLSLSVGTGMGPLVSSNLIQPIGDLVDEYGQAMLEDCGASIAGGIYEGELYGVGPAYITTNRYGLQARKDLLDKYGIEYDTEKVYTLDEIEEIFATIKAGEGENFYCATFGGIDREPLYGAAFALDRCVATTASGVLMLERDFKDTTLVNLYETEEYKEYVERMYDWAQKGYISKDAVTNTETSDTLISGGNYLGVFAWTTVGYSETLQSTTGYEMVGLTTCDGYRSSDTANTVLWSVPVTSGNPEKAVQALNYIYEHEECAWMLQYGLEGVSYEVLEETEEGTLIQYLGDDPSTLPYYQPYGVYGNRLGWPIAAPNSIDMNAKLIEFDSAIEEAGERVSAIYGYQFASDSVATEYAAVNAVLAQYLPTFNTGAVDPAEMLPEFQEALKAAGIDKVIEENQRQLDEWLAAQ